MAIKKVSQKDLAAAIQELGIDAPIYATNYGKGGTIHIVTRDGIFTYTPPKAKPATKKVSKANTAPKS